MIICRIIVIGALSLISLNLALSQAKGQGINPAIAPSASIPPSYMERTKLDWTNDKWTGDDRPYIIARRQIDQAYAAGKSPEPLIQKYRVATEKGPRIHTASSIFYNPLACYRWGYAAWKTVSAKSSLKEQGKHLSGVSEALASASSPHIYEYTRLRFFVEAWYIPSSKLKNVGLRLLKHSPGDLDVKYHMTRILTQIVTAQNNRLALSYAKDLVHSRPQRPSSYAALGGVYDDSWEFLGNKADAAKAIAAYQHCLVIMPPDTYWRSDIVQAIARIERRTAAHK
jgi:hypothetical protein